jgi:hypothetical protein
MPPALIAGQSHVQGTKTEREMAKHVLITGGARS